MSGNLLDINNLQVRVEDKVILKDLNLTIKEGEVHVIMGPNGAGKSTLGYTIMGHPGYGVDKGNLIFEGEDITDYKTDARAKKGIFLSFQNPEELSGVTLENFTRTSKNTVTGEQARFMTFRKELYGVMEALDMDKDYANRYLNVGFSGGEKKKSEILQMLMLQPKLAILDETDSGLDVDAVRLVSKGVEAFKNDSNSLLIITHNTKILEYLSVDYVHILVEGKIVKSGDRSLIKKINENGYKDFITSDLSA
ncbi:Fe-S cluster assembly ATPase SufC [Anaerocolumna aminovalerica]|jgi:Fe-S cluster assembly ATP-binding protein|uniref:Iron-regulated ABC transporter ATPase subunit SufC n=1 Tax=Anaerocolumna aminovalerica TaxID=1527 RepID=A0A1I5G1S4_9FIRM|nr:Fe-S cluster assembly ATPase SufC [Anaerocolumna aminovalerica]MDU6265407.1 Fe-S cluster assembly ATPase SufC [Anaerocolumna aminovalerica]SFO29922.1 Iron-regulated ABC transporter ATPase subunit SufC [Anaerocolumna aminovalerica]